MNLHRLIILFLFAFISVNHGIAAEENGHAELIPVCDVNDPSYKKIGGRNICKRECRVGEIGPNGKLCETRNESGSEEKFCDCGV